jgi:hypothetical protein
MESQAGKESRVAEDWFRTRKSGETHPALVFDAHTSLPASGPRKDLVTSQSLTWQRESLGLGSAQSPRTRSSPHSLLEAAAATVRQGAVSAACGRHLPFSWVWPVAGGSPPEQQSPGPGGGDLCVAQPKRLQGPRYPPIRIPLYHTETRFPQAPGFCSDFGTALTGRDLAVLRRGWVSLVLWRFWPSVWRLALPSFWPACHKP